MITWIRENAWLSGAVGFCITAVATVAIAYYQLSGLVAAQPEIQRHLYNTSRHVDPEEKKKQEERISDLERRIRELESQRWQRFIDRQRNQNDFRGISRKK